MFTKPYNSYFDGNYKRWLNENIEVGADDLGRLAVTHSLALNIWTEPVKMYEYNNININNRSH